MSKRKKPPAPLFLLPILLLCSPPSSAVDFLFNGFDPSDLTLYGDSTLESGDRRSYLSLSNSSIFSLGRALYKSKIPARSNSTALPFSSSFLFSIAPIPGVLPGHGITFLFAPTAGTLGATSSQHLGLFNLTTNGDPSVHVFAVEFDVFENQEFKDINANHVGIDQNSLTSINSSAAGFWPDNSDSFVNLTLNDGSNYQAWIDYSGGRLNVTMAPASLGKKPIRPLISIDIDLSDLFLDEMYVGFCAATGILVQHHRILGWSFSNTNFSAGEALINYDLTNFQPPAVRSGKKSGGVAVGVSVAAGILLIAAVAAGLVWKRRRRGEVGDGGDKEAIEDWELEYWPHRIGYREIIYATDGFSDRNLIGSGGSGRVYKGVLGGASIAIKLFSQNSEEDARQFLAEVSTLGRVKHRNLVGLKGWCRTRREGGDQMLLVYDYMENGSLDQRIFEAPEPLDWGSRVRILRDVAAGVLYLHEAWGEGRVLHRDIKASNVLLDRDMTGRLGDFGLARIQPHGRALGTSRVVGSAGYLAPEVVRSGRASAATDLYGYGVLVLEVACGRRPVEEGLPPLVGWARGLAEKREAWRAVDPRARGTIGFDEGEADRVVQVGLACTCDEPAGRPTIREVVRALEGQHEMVGGGVRECAEVGLLEAKLCGMGSDKPWVRGGAHQRQHLTFAELRHSMRARRHSPVPTSSWRVDDTCG